MSYFNSMRFQTLVLKSQQLWVMFIPTSSMSKGPPRLLIEFFYDSINEQSCLGPRITLCFPRITNITGEAQRLLSHLGHDEHEKCHALGIEYENPVVPSELHVNINITIENLSNVIRRHEVARNAPVSGVYVKPEGSPTEQTFLVRGDKITFEERLDPENANSVLENIHRVMAYGHERGWFNASNNEMASAKKVLNQFANLLDQKPDRASFARKVAELKL